LRDELVLVSYSEHLAHLNEVVKLEHLVQLRNQFLSIASHELKTPLTAIYGMLQLQERMSRAKSPERVQDPDREKMHSFLKLVIRQVERLNEMIDGLLDVSRIQAGRFSVDPADTEVLPVIQELVAARMGPIAKDAGVRLQIDAPEGLYAWVDPLRFEEVVTNLVMNAVRFSPEGGAVRIKITPEGNWMKLSVRDQGPAVPREDRERIFQPFERAQRTSRLGGLGLGLFVSRQIPQLHGGDVNLVESVPGKGNLFEATFPLRSSLGTPAPEAQGDREQHQPPENPERRTARGLELNSR
jgi:signal transduction histidine kinase